MNSSCGHSAMNISQFLDQLDKLAGPIPLHELKELLEQLEIEPAEVQRHMQFNEAKYQRNLLRRTPAYEALLLCFEAGQRTPIHDHCGSACGVRIIEGAAMETIFQPTPDGWLYATGTVNLPQGGVVGSNDMDIHQLSNLQTDRQRLVTLHIYTPPLGEVGNYSITDNTVTKVMAPTRDALVAAQND